jgi:hypothetical protein
MGIAVCGGMRTDSSVVNGLVCHQIGHSGVTAGRELGRVGAVSRHNPAWSAAGSLSHTYGGRWNR